MITSHLVCCVLLLLLALMHLLSTEYTWISVTPCSLIPVTSFAAHPQGLGLEPRPHQALFCHLWAGCISDSLRNEKERERELERKGGPEVTLWFGFLQLKLATGSWNALLVAGHLRTLKGFVVLFPRFRVFLLIHPFVL